MRYCINYKFGITVIAIKHQWPMEDLKMKYYFKKEVMFCQDFTKRYNWRVAGWVYLGLVI